MSTVSVTTVSETVARFFAVFGLFVVLTMVGVGIYQAVLLDGVYDEIGPDQLQENGQPDPAALTDPEVRGDYQDVRTIDGWTQPMLLLGLGSILTGIILTFAVVIYRGVKTISSGMPSFIQRYMAGQTGSEVSVENRVDDDVELPFGGGA